MIAALLTALFSGLALACEPLAEPPEAVQVAWVSKLQRSAGNDTWLQVVPLASLRELVQSSSRDSTRVLRGLGLLGRTQKLGSVPYKVTVFEVERGQLCRAMDGEPGATVAGVPVCDTPEQRPGPGTRAAAYSGCGYLTDQASGTRGADVFRIPWSEAVRKGFCVLPWERFLAEG